MARIWSPYQEAIYRLIEDPRGGNAIVNAVAGSGKSTTMVESCARIPPGRSHVMLAFNKAIAEELKSRGVNGRTFHSVCYGPVTKFKGTSTVESNKLRILCKEGLTSDDEFIYGSFISRLVGLARQGGIGCLYDDIENYWYALIEHHDLELENERGNVDRAVQLARWLLTVSNGSHMVDFDDLLYFAIKDNIVLPKFDFIFVDEAQDTNQIQREILRKMMHPHSRLIAVGDPAQAIYGFRGADSTSLAKIAEEFHARTMPLTVSYRCGQKIVQEARKWVAHIEPAPDAPEGEVLDLGTEWDVKVFGKEDLIVCRTTKPLVALAYKFMKERIPAQILGRDIGAGLASLIKKQKTEDLDVLVDKIEAWARREVAAAMDKRLEAKADAQQDKADAIICLVETLGEHERTVHALLNLIGQLFTDKLGNGLKLATIHKSKGMEADTVWWLNSSQCPAKWARREWQQEQERNLCYVAITRAKYKLGKIEDGSAKRKRQDELSVLFAEKLSKEINEFDEIERVRNE